MFTLLAENSADGTLRQIRLQTSALQAVKATLLQHREQVWINLISNALKYSSKNSDAQVRISGPCNEVECTYSVSDNGALRYGLSR